VVLAGQGEQNIPSKGFGRKLVTMKWVQGSSYSAFELGLAVICSGRYPLQKLCTHQYPLSRVDDAMKTSGGQGDPGAIHVSINPWT
jgi:threonine dehydrogenase-like Zn-dependent dehydrogenase